MIVVSCTEQAKLRTFEQQLRQVENLRILLSGGSAQEGSKIVIALDKPVALIRLLRNMPMVQDALYDDDRVRVTI